jgi:hypothetical protein
MDRVDEVDLVDIVIAPQTALAIAQLRAGMTTA